VKTIFVDGYNVINSWPNIKPIIDYSLDSARQKLIEIMQNYAEYTGDKVFVVFDAHMVKGSIEKKERMGNVIVVFTKYGETADSYIERAANNMGRKVEICVVTSDLLEQQLVFQRGAVRKSSIEFYNEINNINSKLRKKIKKRNSETKNRLEDLLEENILEKLDKIRKSH